uniref:Uncharacterized protein n=1 Tax=Rhizophora mucronata TaxID=61149 RepID=A0A2P2R302_RHIMU
MVTIDEEDIFIILSLLRINQTKI